MGIKRKHDLPRNKNRSIHVIREISFSRNTVICECDWSGQVDDFQPHRKEMVLVERESLINSKGLNKTIV